ncbi:MAG: PQQ-binding-like beta-propeller repeat protein [Acidimicrobiia bacterium]
MTGRRVVGIAVAGMVLGALAFAGFGLEPGEVEASGATTTTSTSSTTSTLAERVVETPTTTTTTEPPPLVPGVGEPYGEVPGLTMFRGNPSRTYYGSGPLPTEAPRQQWAYPESAMCGSSAVGGESKVWCGTGWTGQPVVWERPDGITEVIFGAYDKAVHFVDAETGLDTRSPFPTGDIIKGSVTLDPDGFPLLYTGSRDNKLRAIALDREPVEELWALDASVVAGRWNNDWDGNPLIHDGILYEGGENSWFFAIELNRRYDPDGLVTLEPEILVELPGWTDELLAEVGPNVSIENSVVMAGDRVYFANSGGRIVGLDVSDVRSGSAPIVFDYWAGDDIDATLVADAEGMIYAAIELERRTERSREVGQLIKLDPFATGEPRVWGVDVPPIEPGDGGIWATPALGEGHIYVTTHTGDLLTVDTETGEVTDSQDVGPHAWSSPVIVDGDLLVSTCETAELRRYDLTDPSSPSLVWSAVSAQGCIESTPAVWDGVIYVGSRDGFMRAYR